MPKEGVEGGGGGDLLLTLRLRFSVHRLGSYYSIYPASRTVSVPLNSHTQARKGGTKLYPRYEREK